MPAPTLNARPARPDELGTVIELSLGAFADEAVISWLLPDPEERRLAMRRLFSASLEWAIASEALILALDADGTPLGWSIWLPGDSGDAAPDGDDEAADDPVSRRVAAVDAATRHRRPTTPHLKLDSMATLPEHRGRGAGSAMLAAGLTRARDLGLPVYLEASTSDNRRLYERVGFRDLGEPIVLPDGGPRLQPMWLDG